MRKGLIISALLCCSAYSAFAQDQPSGRLTPRDIAQMKGNSILSDAVAMRWTLNTDNGKSQQNLRFRVEEISFEPPRELQLSTGPVIAKKVWKLTVTSPDKPFPVRSDIPTVWLDNVKLGSAAENVNLSEMTVVLTDISLFARGGLLAFSFGEARESRVTIAMLPSLDLLKQK